MANDTPPTQNDTDDSPKYSWSYSSIGTYQQCPHKYYRLRVLKDIKEPEATHLIYGNDAHKAAELYIGQGTPLEPRFAFMQPILDVMKSKPGGKHCEYKMGLTYDLQPCDFFAKDVWWRGIADLLVDQGDTMRVVDWKTSKSAKYADTAQLELLSLAVFKHFPNVQKTHAGLVFVVSGEFVKANYTRENEHTYWVKWLQQTKQLETSIKKDVWNPKPNFTCKGWCPVQDCPHWEPRRR